MSHNSSVSDEDTGPLTEKPEGLMGRFLRASTLAEDSPLEALPLLESIRQNVAALSLFSSNETIEDVSTKSLPLLALDHFLALALVSLPAGPGQMQKRKVDVFRSIDLWSSFLTKLEQLELLSPEEVNEFQALMEEPSMDMTLAPPAPPRDVKIARQKVKQQAKHEVERLKSLRERRQRLSASDEDELDGHDLESLERAVALTTLSIQKGEAMENWYSAKRELPMIEMMVSRELDQERVNRHHGISAEQQEKGRQQIPLSGKPLQVTHITKDSATGKLEIKRDEIRSQVFRPGWNQPTMSLEELADREVKAAIERDERQKEAEAENENAPRRYEDLIRDGLEDNSELVNASAKLDRDWDDWKDENPRGSGNKMTNRGDRNF
jgi:immunoglobulin-binding protein 1